MHPHKLSANACMGYRRTREMLGVCPLDLVAAFRCMLPWQWDLYASYSYNFVRCYVVISARLLRLLEPALFRSGTERRESETSACRVGCVPLILGRLTAMVCKCGGGSSGCVPGVCTQTHTTHTCLLMHAAHCQPCRPSLSCVQVGSLSFYPHPRAPYLTVQPGESQEETCPTLAVARAGVMWRL